MRRMLKVSESYKSQAGRVNIINQMAPDVNGYSFIGSVPGGSSVLYKADGYCEAEQYRITGPWISDDVVYLPIIRSPSVIGERFADLTALRKAHPGKWALRLQFVDDEPEVGVEAP